jgi:hypothetical protein
MAYTAEAGYFNTGAASGFFQDFQFGMGCNRTTGGAGQTGTHWGLRFWVLQVCWGTYPIKRDWKNPWPLHMLLPVQHEVSYEVTGAM